MVAVAVDLALGLVGREVAADDRRCHRSLLDGPRVPVLLPKPQNPKKMK